MLVPGKVVLITGASGGIGAACAHAFGRRGALLSLTARSAIVHDSALVTTGDILSPGSRERVVEATLERFGRIDILINNAGRGAYQPSCATPLEDVRALFELNLFAPLAMIQLVVPHMRRARSGVIVNVGSIAGRIAVPWMTAYSASKSALSSLSNGLRIELAADGIRVLEVCPGYVDTGFQSHAAGTPPPGVAGAKRFAISAGRCAEEIARAVERDARAVVTPYLPGWFFIWLNRLFPTMLDSRLSRLAQASH